MCHAYHQKMSPSYRTEKAIALTDKLLDRSGMHKEQRAVESTNKNCFRTTLKEDNLQGRSCVGAGNSNKFKHTLPYWFGMDQDRWRLKNHISKPLRRHQRLVTSNFHANVNWNVRSDAHTERLNFHVRNYVRYRELVLLLLIGIMHCGSNVLANL